VFEWDPAKSEWNERQRGFGFDIVESFDWATARIVEDLRKDYGERRFLAFGRCGSRFLAIAFTPRDDVIRIISVRQMHQKEVDRYEL
jgi:uncharacterized DUF497 family protein